MTIKIILFGRLKEMADRSEMTLDGITDTDQAFRALIDRYPCMEGLTCLIALDKQLIHANTTLKEGQELAVLPPYSGG